MEYIGRTTPHENRTLFINSMRTAFILLVNIVCLGQVSCISSKVPSHQSQVLWRKSLTPVSTGLEKVDLLIELISPCELITNHTVHPDLVEMAKEKCEDKYRSKFEQPIQSFCPLGNFSNIPTVHRRRQRAVGVITFVSITLVATGLGLGYSVVKVNERVETLEKSINQVTDHVQDLKDEYNYLKKDFLLKMQKEIDGYIKDQDIQLGQLKSKSLSMSYAISYITTKLLTALQVIKDAERSWKHGKIHPHLLDFFNVSIPCNGTCPLESAKAQKCQLSYDKKFLKIQFTIPEANSSMALYEADPFQIYQDKGNNEFCVQEYTGPKRLITSENHKCQYPVRPTSDKDVVFFFPENCKNQSIMLQSQDMFNTTRCEKKYAGFAAQFVQVKQSDQGYAIYCYGNRITVDGKTKPCPPTILFANSTFEINNVLFSGQQLNFNQAQTHDFLLSNVSLTEIENSTRISIFSNIQKEDEEREKRRKKLPPIKKISYSHDFISENFWILIAGLFVILVIIAIVYLITSCKRKSTRRETEERHRESSIPLMVRSV